MKAESVMYTSLDFYWMPFAANRQFKKAPRLSRQADGMHLEKTDGRQAPGTIAMSWWLNARNWRTRIADLLSRIDGSTGHSAVAPRSLKVQSDGVDIGGIARAGRVKFAALRGAPTKRAFDIFLDGQEHEVLVRTTGDIVALSPPFVETVQADRRVDTLGQAIRRRA